MTSSSRLGRLASRSTQCLPALSLVGVGRSLIKGEDVKIKTPTFNGTTYDLEPGAGNIVIKQNGQRVSLPRSEWDQIEWMITQGRMYDTRSMDSSAGW